MLYVLNPMPFSLEIGERLQMHAGVRADERAPWGTRARRTHRSFLNPEPQILYHSSTRYSFA